MKKSRVKKFKGRSKCPISCSLEIIGDKWSLLIIRDMFFMGKCTYNEFLQSPEGIATNILTDRLVKLTDMGIIKYTGTAKRKEYSLTKMGLDLKPVIDAIGTFGMKHFEGSKEYVKEQMKEANK
ncbi:MAG TPA: helix-turn-helix domain-containing protein [Bacteroidia bacterium]|jgi:DNA-binding HxlR family transcriptional regulator|nr:helix-turn-helix domain-containing protein [Bacteroidia bacterium]